MENFYTAYRKTIDGVTFYFVKKYQTFPEYKDVPSVLENYGMHTDFKKACKIAMISDKAIQQQLLDTLEIKTTQTKVIQLNRTKANSAYRMWQKSFSYGFKLINAR
jgi:hypothetical protein